MKHGDEIIILEDGNVRITNQRAVFGIKSFPLSDINSVKIRKDRSMVGCLIGTLIVGALIVGLLSFANPEISSGFRIAAAILLGGAIIVAILAQPNYILQITGESGKADVLQSMDQEYLETIVGSIHGVIGDDLPDERVRAADFEQASR